MASWGQVVAAVRALQAQQLNDTMWQVEMLVSGTDRAQRVFLMHEVLKPDMEFVKVTVPLGFSASVSAETIVHKYGSLTVGSFSYIQLSQGGMLFLGYSLPLQLLDLSDLNAFLLHLQLLANAADMIQTQL
jgi:hypothetical protein